VVNADYESKEANISSLVVTSCNENICIFEIEFENPKRISSYEIDKLRFRFINSFVVEAAQNASNQLIPNWKTNYHDIPPQITVNLNIKLGATILVSSMNVLTMGGVALNFLLSLSLNLVWTMVNTLQLIVHLPLFSVVHPSNILYFYTLLIGVASFSIIDVQEIQQRIFEFSEGDSHTLNFKLLGYES